MLEGASPWNLRLCEWAQSRPGLVWVITAAFTIENHRHAMQEDRVFINFSLEIYFLLLITSTFKLNAEITVLMRIDCRTLY